MLWIYTCYLLCGDTYGHCDTLRWYNINIGFRTATTLQYVIPWHIILYITGYDTTIIMIAWQIIYIYIYFRISSYLTLHDFALCCIAPSYIRSTLIESYNLVSYRIILYRIVPKVVWYDMLWHAALSVRAQHLYVSIVIRHAPVCTHTHPYASATHP